MAIDFKPKFNRVVSERIIGGLIHFKLKMNTDMFKQAACFGIDTDIFYPDKNVFTPDEISMLTRMCNSCPIKDGCLEWALAHERDGVWGGTVPYQRNLLRKKLKIQLTEPGTGVARAYNH